MPSASAKIEKLASAEAADPVKQFHLLLEKKVRNMEKRKLKLDNYRADVKKGKELNEDQKTAVSKYDQVVEVLDYSKELCKCLDQIAIETSRAQKKLAKKEQIERQQYEIQRLQEAFHYKHILSCLENGEAREDFLNGSNGAIKLSAEDMHLLDQLYKLIERNLPNEHSDVESHFRVLSENFIFLVEGKTKEVAGTTYKNLKDLLLSIKVSGYFSKPIENNEVISSDDAPELEDARLSEAIESAIPNIEKEIICEIETANVNDDTVVQENSINGDTEVVPDSVEPESAEEKPCTAQNGSLQEVLPEGNFNFLQESQIEVDTPPHMDPAVVAVHQLPPHPPYQIAAFTGPPPISSHLPNGISHSPMQPMVSAAPAAIVPHNSSPEFDPNHPIPTQTYTNQSFAVMQNMMMPPAYVPVTMHHGPLPPHLTSMAVLPTALSPPISAIPVPVAVAATESPKIPIVTENEEVQDTKVEHAEMNGNEEVENEDSVNQNANSKNGDEAYNNHNNYQRGYRPRGRGRGSGGGYYRPRGGFNGVGRGGYQNHGYYQNNFRRGGPRGGGRGNGNTMRGGGRPNYRPPPMQQQ